MEARTSEQSTMLTAARGQREALHHALVALEEAIAAPTPGRIAEWSRVVHDALVDVAAAFERHIAVTEGPDGLLAEIVRAAPRLSNASRALGDEHEDIRGAIANTLVSVRDLAHPQNEGATTEVREAVLDVLRRLSQHRQRGSDLVFEAYAVDIGVGD